MPRKRILSIFLGLAFVLLAFLILLALLPVPLPMSPKWLHDHLNARYFQYEVEFRDAHSYWRPQENVINVHFEDTTLKELGGEAVAAIPEVVLTFESGTFLSGAAVIQRVKIFEPRIRIVQTDGGSFKIDIGHSEDGLSGSLFMDLLTDIAASHDMSGVGSRVPELELAEGTVFLENLMTGVHMRLDLVDAIVRSAPAGVITETSFIFEAAGENISAALKILFSTARQSFSLSGRFKNVIPAVFSDRLPNVDFLEPLELAVDGELSVRFNRRLELDQAEIMFGGVNGSLELAELIGRDIPIRELSARVLIEKKERTFRINDLVLKTSDHEIGGFVTGVSTVEGLQVAASLTLSSGSWSDVLPLWLVPLESMIASDAGLNDGLQGPQEIVFDVLVAHQTGRLSGYGILRAKTGAKESIRTSVDESDLARLVELSISGSWRSPALQFHIGSD